MDLLTRTSLTKEVRAILDSTPQTLSSHQIEQDYRNLCGKSLKESCRKLGFKDTDSFLVAISKDNAVTLEHAPGGGYQYSAGIADSSTSHIQDLVKKQSTGKKRGASRGPSSGGFQRGRANDSSRWASSRQQSTPQLSKSVKQNIISLLKEKKHAIHLSNLVNLYHSRYGSSLNYRTLGFASLRQAISSIEEVELTHNADSVMIRCHTNAPLITSASVENVRQKLKDDIRKVVGDEEIPLTRFSGRYEQVFDRQLSAGEYGYSSLLNLLGDLVDVVDMRRQIATGDWIICKATAPGAAGVSPKQRDEEAKTLPQELVNMIQRVVQNNPHGVYIANFDKTFKLETGINLHAHTYGYESVSAMLAVCLNKEIELVTAKFGPMIRLVPSEDSDNLLIDPSVSSSTEKDSVLHDAVGPGVGYNKPAMPPLNKYIEMIVSQVYTPSDFFLQVMGTLNTGKRLEELMDNLEEFYDVKELSRTYLLPKAFALPGQVAVCRFPNDQHWHRARITRVIDDNFVQVLFVDYGTSCAVLKSQLFFLAQRFLVLPYQAQSATLFGVFPVNGDSWHVNATKTFFNLTTAKRLCGVVMEVDKAQKLAVCLTDTNGPVDLHINDYLVSSNFAKFCDETKQLLPAEYNKKDLSDLELSSDDSEDDERPASATNVYKEGLLSQPSNPPRDMPPLEHVPGLPSNAPRDMPPLEHVPGLPSNPPRDMPPLEHVPGLPSNAPRDMPPLEHVPGLPSNPPRDMPPLEHVPGLPSNPPRDMPPLEHVPGLPSNPPRDMPPLEHVPGLPSNPPRDMPPLEHVPGLPSNPPRDMPPLEHVPGLLSNPPRDMPPLEHVPGLPSNPPRDMPPLEHVPGLPSNPPRDMPPLEHVLTQPPTAGVIDNPPPEVVQKIFKSPLKLAKVQPQQIRTKSSFPQDARMMPHNVPFYNLQPYMNAQHPVPIPNHPYVLPQAPLPGYQVPPVFYYGQQQYPALPPALHSHYLPQPGSTYYGHHPYYPQQVNYRGSQSFSAPPPLEYVDTVNLPSESVDTATLPPLESVDTATLPPLESVDTATLPPLESVDTATLPPLESVDTATLPPLESVDTAMLPPPEPRALPMSSVSGAEATASGQHTEGERRGVRMGGGQQRRKWTSDRRWPVRRGGGNGCPPEEFAEALRFKLNGLKLKQKRLMREKSHQSAADYSGAESSDSELSHVEKEIENCSTKLSGMTGLDGAQSKQMPKTGRGRGLLQLLGLSSID